MKRWKLSCVEVNDMHIKWNLFDTHGVNCGTVTVLRTEVVDFLQQWHGAIEWNNKIPPELLE